MTQFIWNVMKLFLKDRVNYKSKSKGNLLALLLLLKFLDSRLFLEHISEYCFSLYYIYLMQKCFWENEFAIVKLLGNINGDLLHGRDCGACPGTRDPAELQ